MDDTGSLADAVRSGDAAAEHELVARYRPGVIMLLRRLVKDAALADDLSQEVFRIAFESLRAGRLDEGSKLAAYLWGITRNVGNSEVRRRRQRRYAPAGEELVDVAPRPDQVLLQEERTRLVRHAVRALSRRDRAVLEAFYLRDEPKDTICRRLGLSPAQFDVIKWRALKRLEAVLRHREDA